MRRFVLIFVAVATLVPTAGLTRGDLTPPPPDLAAYVDFSVAEKAARR